MLQRCLEKDPRRRLRDIGDARLELDVTDAVSMQPEAPTTRQKWPLVLAGAAVAGALISVFLWLSARAAPSSVRSGSPVRFTLTFDGLTTDESVPAPSPDGTHAVLGARDAEGHQSLWLRTMDSGTVQRIGGTDDGSSPFWSKDGHWIGFYADGKLKKVSVSGGSPQTVKPVPIDYPGSQGASWNGSGEIIFTTSNRGGLSVVHDPGGTARALTTLDRARTENSHRHPQFLPDGVHFIFMARCNLRENDALYLGRLDTGETHRVLSVRSNVQYVSDSNGKPRALLFVRDGTLMEQPFDGARNAGYAVPTIDHVSYSASSASGAFRLSGTGDVLVFRPDLGGLNQMVWFDRNGRADGALAPPGAYGNPRVSPDGRRVLFSRTDDETGNRDLRDFDSANGAAQRLTTSPANDWQGVWSGDSRRILFTSDRGDEEARRPSSDLREIEPGSGGGGGAVVERAEPHRRRWPSRLVTRRTLDRARSGRGRHGSLD